jgi:glycosyltransferase involved in cell wall biosynthesis
MTTSDSPGFAIYAQDDAYSTAKKAMGRQAAGEALVRGLARTWPAGQLEVVTQGSFDRDELARLLGDSGFRGRVRWSPSPEMTGAVAAGALYYPGPPLQGAARLRNRLRPSAFSLMGVTHTLSVDRSLDSLSALILPPFKPWDALICTSTAALEVVQSLFAEVREGWSAQGFDRFVPIQTPVIPLGVHCDLRAPSGAARAQARQRFGVAADEVVVLFAGRLSFHGKANPAAMYRALQAVSKDARLVCIEAGQHANAGIEGHFAAAQKALAPDVRFIHAPGQDPALYASAWSAADIFCSLSDNVQETFGLTPVEAMAAGLPVIATDWNGYRDNVRDGVDGYLIPTLAAPPGAGADLGVAVETGRLTYDRQIGIVSLGVAVDARILRERLHALATDAGLRAALGANGRARALSTFDWPVVLAQYEALARRLAGLRRKGDGEAPEPWPQRADPFRRFAGFATRAFGATDLVTLAPDAEERYRTVSSLAMANYQFDDVLLPRRVIEQMLRALHAAGGAASAGELLAMAGGPIAANYRALAWLAKFELVEISEA